MSRAEERRKSRTGGAASLRWFYVVLGVVALIGVGAVGYNVTSGTSGGGASVPIDLDGSDDPEALVARARGVTKGDPNASVTIVEFGDYQCPACGQFAREYKAAIELALVETGRAKFVFHDYPLVAIHPNAFIAARAARCAEDQGKFWEYHDELFRQQVRWSTLPNPAGALEGYASALGLDAAGFRACLQSDRHADLVTANMQLAEALGIPSTPTILINVAGGETREAPGWDVGSFTRTIDEITAARPTN